MEELGKRRDRQREECVQSYVNGVSNFNSHRYSADVSYIPMTSSGKEGCKITSFLGLL